MGLLDQICHRMWSLTPYDRCDFRCVYCCTRVQGTSRASVSTDDFETQLATALERVPTDELVIMGAYCDAYPQLDERLALARRALQVLDRTPHPFSIVTKSRTVLRDLDLLVRHRDRCIVEVSICTTDDAILRRLDPEAPSGTERFGVLHALHDAGLTVHLNALPWIPDVSDTAGLIRRTPRDVQIIFAPLATGVDRDTMTLLGRRYTRRELWERYFEEYDCFGHVPNTSWVRPSLPPAENDPMFRLPMLAS